MLISTSKLVKDSTLTASVVGMMTLLNLVSARPSFAAVINGGFETGNFTGWSTIGDTSIQTAKQFGNGATDGSSEAFLSTASVASDKFNFSGKDAVASSKLETFLGLAPGNLNSLESSTFRVTQGSAIKQTFTANAGDTLSLNYNFLTDENKQSLDFNSFAFAVLQPDTIKLADTFSSFKPSSTFFNQETGFQTFSTVIPTSGTYTLELGAVDVGEAYSSGLLVDNVRIASVPEPSSKLGVLAFSALVGVRLLKRK